MRFPLLIYLKVHSRCKTLSKGSHFFRDLPCNVSSPSYIHLWCACVSLYNYMGSATSTVRQYVLLRVPVIGEGKIMPVIKLVP